MIQRNRWWLVVASGLAIFMVALDSSIVTVALPTIGAHFRAPATVTQWATVAWTLAASTAGGVRAAMVVSTGMATLGIMAAVAGRVQEAERGVGRQETALTSRTLT